MKLSTRFKNNVYIILLEGNMTMDDSHTFSYFMKPLIAKEEFNGIILNLKDCAFIDSQGIGSVIRVFKTLQAKSIPLVLCHLNPKFKSIMENVGLDRVLTLCDTEDEAFQLITKGPSPAGPTS